MWLASLIGTSTRSNGTSMEHKMFPRRALIETGRYTIGRSYSNSLVLDDITISRQHCVIKNWNGRWVLIDKRHRPTYFITVNMVNVEGRSYYIRNHDVIGLTPAIMYVFKRSASSNKPTLELKTMFDNESNTVLDGGTICDTPPAANEVTDGNEVIIDLCNSSVIEVPKSPKKPKLRISFGPMQEELSCAICQEIFINAMTLNCKHSFCSLCLMLWREKNNICPLCRTKISDVVPSLVIDNLCDNLMRYMPEKDRECRRRVMVLRDVDEMKMMLT